MTRRRVTRRSLARALDQLAGADREIAKALESVGHPPLRTSAQGFETLLRIIVGQQLSSKAAATIFGRLEEALGGTCDPAALLRLRSPTLRRVGLSRQKMEYARLLARAVSDGSLDLERLPRLDDDAVVHQITALKGFGVWSAQMYLMFSLGRPDVWPVDDLGVREGVARIKGLTPRPSPKELHAMGEAWRPHRSAVAFFAWHYLANAPMG